MDAAYIAIVCPAAVALLGLAVLIWGRSLINQGRTK
jgi:hypothetical protein